MFMVFWSRKEKPFTTEGSDPPVKEEGRKRADHEHERQGLERQDEVRSRVLEQERRRSAADVAEHEGGARPGRRFKGQDDVVQEQEELLEEGDIEENAGDAELDNDAGERHGVLDASSVLADEPGDPGEYHEAEQCLKKHTSSFK